VKESERKRKKEKERERKRKKEKERERKRKKEKERERKRKKEIKVMGVEYKADKKNHKREEFSNT
jgi:hypothetical protein